MIDEIDRKLVRALNKDARRSYRELAKDAGTSTTAVIHAAKRLEASGAIRGYIPDLNPALFGYDWTAIIAVSISQGKLLETQKWIARDPQVQAVYDVTGEWDSIVIARFRGRAELNSYLKKLNASPFISRTVTHIVLNTVKEERRIPV
jgi:DNA-binding Lrp family transcriptional regulator